MIDLPTSYRNGRESNFVLNEAKLLLSLVDKLTLVAQDLDLVGDYHESYIESSADFKQFFHIVLLQKAGHFETHGNRTFVDFVLIIAGICYFRWCPLLTFGG